jgi:hypothetical protein
MTGSLGLPACSHVVKYFLLSTFCNVSVKELLGSIGQLGPLGTPVYQDQDKAKQLSFPEYRYSWCKRNHHLSTGTAGAKRIHRAKNNHLFCQLNTNWVPVQLVQKDFIVQRVIIYFVNWVPVQLVQRIIPIDLHATLPIINYPLLLFN